MAQARACAAMSMPITLVYLSEISLNQITSALGRKRHACQLQSPVSLAAASERVVENVST